MDFPASRTIAGALVLFAAAARMVDEAFQDRAPKLEAIAAPPDPGR